EFDKVALNLDVFRYYAEGFLSETGEILSDGEKNTFADSSLVMTLELASRYLTDYLSGDKYFKAKYPTQNLDRAKNLIALAKDMLGGEDYVLIDAEENQELAREYGVMQAPTLVVVNGEEFSSFDDKEKSVLGGERVVTTPEYTAYLKIAEGCDNRCTYCAIPLIRGGFRSRPMEDIIAEAKDLEQLGVKELNLIAQDTSRYGLDLYGEYKLAELARKITEETKIPWVRLLYCYPDKITDELIDEMKNNPRIVKYLDLPIQHISDKVLKDMNRHGDSNTIKDTINRVRAAIPNCTLRTTVIVGFPGETQEDFDELCEFVKETKFDRLGAFTYSREEDTPSYDFDNQIDEQTKQDRYDIIMREQQHIAAEKNEQFIGQKMKVLCESYDQVAEIYYGRGQGDAPDIDTKVYFKNPSGAKRIQPGEFVTVRIEETVDYDLLGTAIR
ncbi:MAG: 30S ribosomal protein S12 methylthiotransferase RimO, partial [Clostridia bacterium]|nr:30S ribosomal protein S12 methylthiotransferase RimO [Clostridia bacterium]